MLNSLSSKVAVTHLYTYGVSIPHDYTKTPFQTTVAEGAGSMHSCYTIKKAVRQV